MIGKKPTPSQVVYYLCGRERINGEKSACFAGQRLRGLENGYAAVGQRHLLAHQRLGHGENAFAFEDLAVARADGRYPRLLASLAKVRLLILDDWAITPMTADQRRDLLEVVEDRCGRASTLVASQIPVAEWHAAIGDATLADAILEKFGGDSVEEVSRNLRGYLDNLSVR